MDQYRVLRVVVASPGDVKAERDIVPRVIEELNRNIAHKAGLHLDLYRWETDSHPGFHPLGPQELIDPKLKIEDCGLLIGIFWRRFGTPVSDAKSGTEHEFRIAYEAWKKNGKPQIFVYFSQKAYTPKSKEETDQWGLVLQFKKDFPKEGLWWDYKNKDEFGDFLRNHLSQFVNDHPAGTQQSPQAPPPIAAPPLLTPLFQLPPPPADFTGRETELRELREAILNGGVYISGLQGQGGVGKTALALKLAAELGDHFPDAQIHLDLKGASEKPLTAAEALAHVVRSFHPEAKLPEKEEELKALFTSVLHGKRVLLLMDNARDAAQVQPLIPPAGSTLLVTSRQTFKFSGLVQKKLDTLPPEDAKELLLKIERRIGSAAETIAKSCGYLALALRLAATAIAEHGDLNPADYAKKLADESKRLCLLPGCAGDPSMEASIALSYNLLSDEIKKFWRMLGIFPDTFVALAAAAVWEIEDEDAAQNKLSELVRFSMLEWDDTAKRYRLHDLMRAFARGKSPEAEWNDAALRHARHYADLLGACDDLYLRGGELVMIGLALFDLEWGNIQAGQAWAAARAEKNGEAAQLCSGYPERGVYVLSLRQHLPERIQWLESALGAARGLKHRDAEGVHLGNLGIAYKDLGQYHRAIEYYERHLAVARETGDRDGEGRDLGNLGVAYRRLGVHRRAVEYFEQSRVVMRDIGDQRGEANSLGNLGNAYDSLGEYRRAIEHYRQCLVIEREIGDRWGEGNALWNMSTTLYELGEHKEAIAHAEAALKIYEQIEHPSVTKVRTALEAWRREG